MNRLSKREKRLIYLLLCLVITAGTFCLLVLPASSARSAAVEELETAKMEYREMQIKLDAGKELNSRRDSLKQQYDELYASLFHAADTEEAMEFYVTDIALSVGVTPDSLSIRTAERAAAQQFGAAVQEKSATDEQMGILSITMDLSGRCTPAQFIALMNAYDSTSKLLVSTASFDEGTDGNGSFVLSVQLPLAETEN